MMLMTFVMTADLVSTQHADGESSVVLLARRKRCGIYDDDVVVDD